MTIHDQERDACRAPAALRLGDVLNPRVMEELVNQLYAQVGQISGEAEAFAGDAASLAFYFLPADGQPSFYFLPRSDSAQ